MKGTIMKDKEAAGQKRRAGAVGIVVNLAVGTFPESTSQGEQFSFCTLFGIDACIGRSIQLELCHGAPDLAGI